MNETESEIIGSVGLGYVGLPLAAAMAEKFTVVGYDHSEERIDDLRAGNDRTREVDAADLDNPRLTFTADIADLADCTFLIVAVPTPITADHDPDLGCLISASQAVGRILRPGMAVVFESTVYPAVTEEVCLPILERESGLKLGEFDLGYSPERINPGDSERTVKRIVKVVSGHDAAALDRIAAVYGAVITAGVHRAPSIATAEASKVIENVQRDLNIALMNELSKIFSLMGLNSDEVLEAAATKWNFHPYHPGLVGGHCIGVDPYYLTHRALQLGYHPEVILAGRSINDSMSQYVAEMAMHELRQADCDPRGAHVWVLGLAFKENVPDFRNSRAIDVVRHLQEHGCRVSVWEPLIGADELEARFEVTSLAPEAAADVDAVILVNGHDAFRSLRLEDLKAKMRHPVLVDVRNFFCRKEARALGLRYVSL